MISENWKNYILLKNIETKDDLYFCENYYGLLISSNNSNADNFISFTPINEKITFEKIYKKNLFIYFSRELIQEDDVEFSLDIISLFNQDINKNLSFDKKLWIEIKLTLDIINNEINSPKGLYLIVKAALKILLLHLVRNFKNKFTEQKVYQKKLYQFLQLLEINYAQSIEPIYYSKKLGISLKYLNELLKKEFNTTAKKIIDQRRLTEIKRELQNNNKTIKEIAYQYGFNSNVSFSRFFKKEVKMTAKEFRLQTSHNLVLSKTKFSNKI